MLATSDKAELKKCQKQWLKKRNACTNQECILNVYQERIAQLTLVWFPLHYHQVVNIP